MNMVQIGMIGVLGALLAIQFKGGKTEYGIYMSVAVSIVLFLWYRGPFGNFCADDR